MKSRHSCGTISPMSRSLKSPGASTNPAALESRLWMSPECFEVVSRRSVIPRKNGFTHRTALSISPLMLRDLAAAPAAPVVFAAVDLLLLSFMLANERTVAEDRASTLHPSPFKLSSPGLVAPVGMTVERAVLSLQRHHLSPAGPEEELPKRFLSAALAASDIFRVERNRILIADSDMFWSSTADLWVRPLILDIWGVSPELRAVTKTRCRFHPVSTLLPPGDPDGISTLDITPSIVREVLAMGNAEVILSDTDFLILSFMLVTHFDPAKGIDLSADDLAHEIEQSRASRRAPMPGLKDRLRAASQSIDIFNVSLFRRRIRLKDASRLEDALVEILTRPRVEAFIERRQERERERLRAEPKPPPPPPPPRAKPPRESPPKPKEMPPPTAIVPPAVSFTDLAGTCFLPLNNIPEEKLDRDPVRPAQARAAAERFALRNGLVEPGPISLGPARYLVAHLAFSVVADVHQEGVAVLIVGEDGSEPDDSLVVSDDSPRSSSSHSGAGVPSAALDWVAARGRDAVLRAASPALREIAARHAREYAWIVARFDAHSASLSGKPLEETDAEIAQLSSSREAELTKLGERFSTHVACSRVTLSWILLPAATVAVTLRRRKAERAITLRVPAGANRVDRLLCEGCHRIATAKPAACDEGMHLLCEACAPNAQGRIACPACGRH